MPNAPDVSLSDLSFDISPSRRENVPLGAHVRSATLRFTDVAFAKVIRAALERAKERLPVDAELISAAFSTEGALIELKVGKGRLLSTTVSFELSVQGHEKGDVRVCLGEIRGLGMGLDGIIGPFIDRLLDGAIRPGVRRDKRDGPALVISPNELFEAQAIPLAFDPKGRWDITSCAGHAEAVFATRPSRGADA